MSPANLAPSAAAVRAFGLRDLGLACECLGTEDVGFGTVAWLRIGPAAPGVNTLPSPDPRGHGGADGPDARALYIGETGQVPELQVENRGTSSWLLPAHLVLSGGWQTRAVERSVVVPAGGSARLPVKCIEAGRWAPRDEHTARSFEVASRTGVRTRWSTAQSMADQLQRYGRFAAEQSTVWQQVDEELTRTPVASRTRSYEAYLKGVKRRLVAEAHQARVRPPLAANGLILFPRSGGFWIEAYPSAGALAEHADDLLSDLFDPGADPSEQSEGFHGGAAGGPTPRPRAEAVAKPSVADVPGLLDALWAAPLRKLEPIAGTVGDGFAMTNGADGPEHAVGAALMVDGGLAHLAVGSSPSRRANNDVSGDRRRSDAQEEGDAPGPAPSSRSPVPSQSGDESRPISVRGPGSRPGLRPAEPASAPGPALRAVPRPPAESAERSAAAKPLMFGVHGEGGANERPRVDLETMRGIFSRARDLLPEGPPARERVQGYRLVRVLDRNISWVDIRITGDGYAVLGSHDRCDLALSNDAGVWLRHLAAICVRLEDDGVGLRLVDLKTDLPFFLDDDTPRWSILARGPFAMRLGRHVICGFPIGPASAENAAPPPAPTPAATHPPEARPRDPHATGVLQTGISVGGAIDARSMPAPSELSHFLPVAPVSQIQDLLGPSASPNHVRVTLERGGMGASVELPEEALEAGVLLGRALNCFDGGLRRIFCEAISRAHVLLVRDRDDVYAFDLCSTNGTRVGGQRIRRHRLSDAGTALELGKKVVFRWHRRE